MTGVDDNEGFASCGLEGEELKDRIHRLRHEVVAVATHVEAIPEGYRLRLADEPGLRERLEEIIGFEAQCCPWLSFDLNAESGDILLEVSGPPGTIKRISALIPELEKRSKTLWQRYGRKGLMMALIFFLFCELPLLVAMIGATGLFGLDAYPGLRWGIVIGGLALGIAFLLYRRLRRRRQTEGDRC